MRHPHLPLFFAALLLATATPAMAQGTDDLAERAAKARAAVKTFAGRLKSALTDALQSGGPEAAISVCKTVAPEIAAATSHELGWSVARTALKLRNADNAPDDWERRVLEEFLAKRAEGADPGTLEHAEITTAGGKRAFRYMKAIPTAELCLTCHGPEVDPALKAKILELYPDDQAIGFNVGDIRGAFTIVQPLEE